MVKMKKRNIPVAIVLAIVCLFTAGGLKQTFASADVSATLSNGYTTANVAAGKTVTLTDKFGEEIPAELMFDLHTGAAADMGALTDGDCEPGGGHKIIQVQNRETGEHLKAFVVLDLEQAYTVTGVGVNFWNDHLYTGIVIQVADSEDFSDAVTIFNNDVGNKMGQGVGYDDFVQNSPTSLVDIQTSPVYGRYVRVSGYSHNEGQTRFAEIAVYGVTEGLAPVAGNLAMEKQSRSSELTLTTELEDASIYYTTDGSIPTEESTEYTAPIVLSSVGRDKAFIRAVAVKDGVATLPSDFKFDMKQQARNVALGILPTLDEGVEPTIWQGNTTFASVTDGATDPTNVIGTANGTVTWLYLDLGEEYRVDTVRVKLFHDWEFGAIIQLSTTEDFSQGNYTVFSNYGKGNNLWDNVDNVPMTADEWYYGDRTFEFFPVQARYLRVYSVNVHNESRFSSWEEIQVWNTDKPDEAYDTPAENVAFGILPTFDAGVEPTIWQGNTTLASVTNGGVDPMNTMGTASPAWLYLDLGEEYTIDTVKAKFWHDWDFGAIIQLSKTADFSQGNYTVYSNWGREGYDWTGVEEVEATTTDYYTGYQTLEFESVQARYLRVFCVPGTWRNTSRSMWEEIQVWSAFVPGKEIPEEEYPQAESAIVKATGIGDFAVANGATAEDFAEKLPTTLNVEDYAGNTGSVTGAWACEDYDADTAGDYVFVFTAEESAFVDVYNILKVKVTVAEPADKAALNALIASAEELDEDKYISDSWATLADPLAEAKAVAEKRLLLQKEVDKAAESLQGAIDALVLRGNKTELNAMLTAVKELTESEYSAASWAALQEEIASAQAIADSINVTQTVVDLALADLTAACDALQKLGDKSALTARYNELKDTQNIHTQASWASFSAALTEAKEILDKEEAYENELTAALNKLNTTFAALVVKANFAALNESIAAAKAKDLTAYTSSSAAAVTESLTAAEAIAANDESAQADIDAAKADLDTKVAALAAKGDKAELNALLATCNYAQDRYTASSFNAYIVAKENAETVAANADAVQTEIDSAKTTLTEKIAALKELGDKTDLLSAVTEAKKISEAGYTAASFAAFEEALTYAESVAESNDVEQATVDEALADLTAKQNALEKDGSGTTKPPVDPEKPGEENPGEEDPKEDEEGCGCGSRVSLFGSIPVAFVLMLAAALLVAKKRKA